jgi:hypothetical protein
MPSTPHGGSREPVSQQSTHTWSPDISFVKPSASCALIAFTNFWVISVAATFFVRRLNLPLIRFAVSGGSALSVAQLFSIEPTHLERSRIVAHYADGGESPSQRHEGPIHPVLPANRRHGTLMLGAIDEEGCCPFERLTPDGQTDLRRLLHVAHPLAIHVGGSDIDLAAVRHEPDRDIVGRPDLRP